MQPLCRFYKQLFSLCVKPRLSQPSYDQSFKRLLNRLKAFKKPPIRVSHARSLGHLVPPQAKACYPDGEYGDRDKQACG